MRNLQDLNGELDFLDGAPTQINWKVFSGYYTPSKIVDREEQLNALKYDFAKPILLYNERRVIGVYGGPGTGKNIMIRKIIGIIEEAQEKNLTTYKIKTFKIEVDAYSTPHGVLMNLATMMGIASLKKLRGYSEVKLSDKIIEKLKQLEYDHYIFVFYFRYRISPGDKKTNTAHFLDRFLRYENYYPGCNKKISLIVMGLSNPTLYVDKDDRALLDVNIHFPPYKPDEIKEILKIHLEDADAKYMVDDDLLGHIATGVSKVEPSDIRIGLNILERSLRYALDEGKEKVNKKHIESAFDSHPLFHSPSNPTEENTDNLDLVAHKAHRDV